MREEIVGEVEEGVELNEGAMEGESWNELDGDGGKGIREGNREGLRCRGRGWTVEWKGVCTEGVEGAMEGEKGKGKRWDGGRK